MNLDDACVISPHGKTAQGYAVIRTSSGKNVYHHRLVLAEKLGITLAELQGKDCRHKCDNPSCVNPSHLELGTRQENVDDMHARGRANKAVGEAASKAKLTADQVLSIRARAKESCTDLAKEFGVSHTAILCIWHRKVWTHI